MKANLTINKAVETRRIIKFIKMTVHSRGFQNIVLACSGGVDSTTTFFLAIKALGGNHVFPLIMPYRNWHEHDITDIKEAFQKAGFPQEQAETINIGPLVDVVLSHIGGGLIPSPGVGTHREWQAFAYRSRLRPAKAGGSRAEARKEAMTLPVWRREEIRLGNIMARCRMILLYDRAKKLDALVLGTENKSEYLLSYFTRFGDEASDIEPIRHLYKTQVYQLAKYLGVPRGIIAKEPTAGLWLGQTDEAEFGFSYKLADQILYGLYEQKLTVKQLVAHGFKEKEVKKVKKWLEDNWFKHELPIVYTGK